MTNKPLICLCRNRFGTRGLFGDGGEADQKQESSCGRRIQASSMHRKSKAFQPRCATEWTSRHKGLGSLRSYFCKQGTSFNPNGQGGLFQHFSFLFCPATPQYLASHSQGWSSPTFDCNVFRRVAGQVLWHHSRNLQQSDSDKTDTTVARCKSLFQQQACATHPSAGGTLQELLRCIGTTILVI